MRNLVSLLLLAAVLTPLWAAGDQEGAAAEAEMANLNRTGQPIVNDTVTLTVMAREAHLAPEPTNWNNLKVPQMFEEMTNVHIEWQAVPNNAVAQKKNLAFASGDLPDLFFPRILSQADEVKYGGLGLLIPLNDLVDEWAPNVAALFERVPQARLAATTPSGNIYSLPNSGSCWIGSSPVTLNIHTGWLEQAGMGIPTDIDQFEAALTYFRDHDMNGNGDTGDEIPFGMLGGNIEQLMSIFGVVDAQGHRMVIDDKVFFTADEPEVRAAIEWLHDIYQKGLIDPEVFTQDNRQFIAKGRSEPTLYGAFMDWHGENIVGTALMYDPETLQRTVYQPLRPLQTATGKPPLWPTTRRFKLRTRDLAITSANEHPEVTMRWIDTIYDPYWGMHWATSLPGEQWLEEGFTDDGRPIYRVTENPSGMSYGEWKHMYSPANSSPHGNSNSLAFVQRIWQPAALMKQESSTTYYEDFMPPQEYPEPGPYFSDELTEEMSILMADVNGYIDKTYARWIVEGGVEEEWDGYVAELQKLNIDRLVEIWQQGYDEFYGL